MSIEFLDSDARALIALQGPKAVAALEDISSHSYRDLYFMRTRSENIAGIQDCRITRCGYTGWFYCFYIAPFFHAIPFHIVMKTINNLPNFHHLI